MGGADMKAIEEIGNDGKEWVSVVKGPGFLKI
jgi:hypothetical protein